jgi:16S rRNA (cytidine1402-2'-O)-methyltransferase
MEKGKLYLIPTVIADGTQFEVIAPQVLQVLPELRYFLVENVRSARRYLSSLKIFPAIDQLHFEVLDKDTRPESLAEFFAPLLQGNDLGVLSESGCPGVADPGAMAVGWAHRHGIEVVPLVGPSSILLALMASGLNGQQFAFHGYLPVDTKLLGRQLKELERESAKKMQTQILIETPYRNNKLFGQCIKVLQDDTMLTVALEVTGPNQFIRTRTVREWREKTAEFPKAPAVFLFLAK